MSDICSLQDLPRGPETAAAIRPRAYNSDELFFDIPKTGADVVYDFWLAYPADLKVLAYSLLPNIWVQYQGCDVYDKLHSKEPAPPPGILRLKIPEIAVLLIQKEVTIKVFFSGAAVDARMYYRSSRYLPDARNDLIECERRGGTVVTACERIECIESYAESFQINEGDPLAATDQLILLPVRGHVRQIQPRNAAGDPIGPYDSTFYKIINPLSRGLNITNQDVYVIDKPAGEALTIDVDLCGVYRIIAAVNQIVRYHRGALVVVQ